MVPRAAGWAARERADRMVVAILARSDSELQRKYAFRHVGLFAVRERH